MNKQEYREYLQSFEWKSKRDDKLWESKFRCYRCGYSGTEISLDVHHLTYDRVGNEKLSDLMVLCRNCHEEAHRPESKELDRITAGKVREYLKEHVDDAVIQAMFRRQGYGE